MLAAESGPQRGGCAVLRAQSCLHPKDLLAFWGWADHPGPPAVPQILTQEDWNVVLYNGMASTSSWAALYFVALMTFGNYVLFNLLVAILVEGFQAEVRRQGEGLPGEGAAARRRAMRSKKGFRSRGGVWGPCQEVRDREGKLPRGGGPSRRNGEARSPAGWAGIGLERQIPHLPAPTLAVRSSSGFFCLHPTSQAGPAFHLA